MGISFVFLHHDGICRGCTLWFVAFNADNMTVIRFQLWNTLRKDLPSDLRINGAITVRHNILHTADLPPRRVWMLCAEFVSQLPGQFPALQYA